MLQDGIEVIGSLAGFLTTASLLPQVLKVIRERETAALSLWTYIVFVCGVSLWIVYGCYRHSLPLVAANVITLALASCVLCFKLYFERVRPTAP